MSRTIRYQPANTTAWISWILGVLVLMLAPAVFHSNLALTVMSQIGTVMIATLSYNMLLGQSGMLSFGHAVYSGLGAFVAIHAMNLVTSGAMWCPISLIPLVGGFGGAFFGVLFGYVTTKKSGTTFAMITLGIGELVFSSSLTFPEFFGGEAGITTNRVIGKAVLGITYGPQIQVYYLIAFWLVVCAAGMYAFTRTPLGRLANAVRDNPERAEFIGYDTKKVRYLVLILSSFFAGIAGGLSAINFEIVSSENVGAARSGAILLFTFLGGAGSFIGPIIGAVVQVFSLVLLSAMTPAWFLYLGIFFVLMVMYAPGGIASILFINWRIARYGLFGHLVKPYLALIVTGVPLFMALSALIEMLYYRQLNGGQSTDTTVYGIAVNIASGLPWVSVLLAAVVAAIVFSFARRYFAQAWSVVQTDIEAKMLRGASHD